MSQNDGTAPSGRNRGGGLIGRDEMNLAEFPITLLTDRPSRTTKTLVFESGHGKLTITGSDDLGLPTAPDADVIIGLIHLTKQRNNFTDPTVPFSRYEMLKLLGWDDRGRHYRRLDESLRRWVGVTLRYDQCWWDNEVKLRVDRNFHILDSVTIYDQEVRHRLRERQPTLPLSSFTWGNLFFQSCTHDNLKRLDLTAYFSLRSSVTKRLYRFLDKRFYVRDEWAFDLRELAFGHVGLSQGYTAAKIKEKLRPAIEELESIGFLKAMTPAERYAGVGRGEWRIRFARRADPVTLPLPGSEPAGVEDELIGRGVTAATARELVRAFPEERIRAQIERADWLREKRPKKITDFGAYIVSAIRDDYAPPAGFESKAERARREAGEQERRRRDRERRQQEAQEREREREAEALVRDYWQRLTPDDQARVEAEALATTDPATREGYTDGPAMLRKSMLRLIRDTYIRRLLNLPTAG